VLTLLGHCWPARFCSGCWEHNSSDRTLYALAATLPSLYASMAPYAPPIAPVLVAPAICSSFQMLGTWLGRTTPSPQSFVPNNAAANGLQHAKWRHSVGRPLMGVACPLCVPTMHAPPCAADARISNRIHPYCQTVDPFYPRAQLGPRLAAWDINSCYHIKMSVHEAWLACAVVACSALFRCVPVSRLAE
jgi:hypothetical protein